MKKFYTYLAMAICAITMTAGFTSCEDGDAVEARTLDGTWTGRIDTYYADRWGFTGNTYRTTIFFNQIDRYGGTGYEVDYNMNDRYSNYYYCEFRWEVVQGEIVIRYADSWNNTYIYDYQLYNDYFEGYMDDGTNRDIHFQLYYDNRFDWSPYRSRYYAPTRSADTDSTQVATDVVSGETDGLHYYACGEFARKMN